MNSKPTDKHQYLVISSCHPHHTKRSIHYSLALRLRRIFSSHDSYTYSLLMNLLTTLPIVVTTKPFSRHKYCVPQTFLVLTHLKTNLLRRLKPLRFVITYNPTLPPECRAHYSQTFPRPLLLRTL